MMNLKEYFYTIFSSLNPESYSGLTSHTLWRAVKYFFFITIVTSIVMFLLFIPAFIGISSQLHDKAQNFEYLDANFSVKLKEPFVLTEDPLIRVADAFNLSDNSSVNLTNEKFLVTEQGISYRQFFFFGKTRLSEWNKDTDLKESLFNSGLNGLILFLMPSLFVWSILAAIAYYGAVIFITYMLSLIVVFIVGYRMSWDRMLKAAIYSATIMILVQLLVLPFYRLFVLPLILYWLLYVIVIFLIKDEKRGGGFSRNMMGKGKKNIFDNDVTVDVDESGNIKSSKHKRSYDEENEGYVELK